MPSGGLAIALEADLLVSWFVYLVRCADDTLYTGIATDVERRVAQHNSGAGAKYTRARRPVSLVYCEEAADRSAASKRECRIKHMTRHEKEELAKGWTAAG